MTGRLHEEMMKEKYKEPHQFISIGNLKAMSKKKADFLEWIQDAFITTSLHVSNMLPESSNY